MHDPDMVLMGRAVMLSLALLCQRVAAAVGRAGIYFEAKYFLLTEVGRV